MDEPIVYVSTWRISRDRFEDYRRFYDELVRVVREDDPEVSVFLAYATDDADAGETTMTSVHVYRDGAALQAHMAVIGRQMGLLPNDLTAVMSVMNPVGIHVLGRPTGTAAEMDRGLADSGVPFTVSPRYLGGVVRHADNSG